MTKYTFLSLLLSICSLVNAQNFNWEAPLVGVKEDGFCKIQLLPSIVSKLSNNMGDIRIYDNSGKEIPYIFESEKAYLQKDYFVEYEIIEKTEQITWPYYTRLIIHNPKKNRISNFYLIINNSDVSKKLKLSGSDDNRKWYIIKDNYRFQAMFSDTETSVIKIIDFPVSSYEYYEILIDDWKNNPINILKAGFYNTSIENGKYSENETPELSQMELKEEKQSLVKVSFKEKQLINKIELKINGPEFYYRDAVIQVPDSVRDNQNKMKTDFITVSDITLNSNSLNTFYFESLRLKEFYIRISNHDDLPLKIVSLRAEQLNHYLICKLEMNKTYKVLFGNNQVNSPEYDIKYFSDKIPQKLPVINAGNCVYIGSKKETKSDGFHLDKRVIWVSIIGVIGLLFYLAMRMLKDMKTQNKSK